VLRESFVVSVSGAAIGTTLAVGAGMLVNGQAAQAGYQLFLFSPRILAFALVFAAALGAIAGTYATVRILRVPPAEAIRRGA
jgi:ABC-type antimicrobial peptide transport system permease subunit